MTDGGGPVSSSGKFETRLDGGAAVVEVGREILDLTIVGEFNAALDAAEVHGVAVAIDLGAVSYLDSVIISQLVKRFVALRQGGRRFILFGCQEYVEELLKSTGLLGVIDIRHDLASALKLAGKPVDEAERAKYSRVEGGF